MNKRLRLLFFSAILCTITFPSCVVQAPAYTSVEKVLTLELGMEKTKVDSVLGIPPFDIKSRTDSSSILIYKYRVTERKGVPVITDPNKGLKAKGKYVDLFLTFSKDNKLIALESCSECEETKEKKTKVDINSIILLLTVTLPSILVYFGLQQ